MRRAIIGILLASTLVTPAFGQAWLDQLRERKERSEQSQGRAEVRGDRRGGNQEAFRDQRGQRDDRGDFRRDDRNDNRGDFRRDGRNDDWRGNAFGGSAFRGNDGRDGRWSNNNGNFGRGGWNDGWRNDRRYNWQSYRSANRGAYRVGRYYGPRGYSYSRWSRGYRVDPFFYGQRYWISDPWAYRLPPAYGSYRWVRYYDDVALVDIRTGLVLDLIESFFW